MTHLSQDQIIQYIHHTMTDAERETMDRHMANCPTCRARLDDHEALQRRIHYDLQSNLRTVRPSSGMKFARISRRVKRSRRWRLFLRGWSKVLNGTVVLVL